MGRTDRWPNIKVDDVKVLDECRAFNFTGSQFTIGTDSEDEKATISVNDLLLKKIQDDAIAFAVALG